MSLENHLEELRKVVIRVVGIILVSFAIAYGFGAQISEILLHPLRVALAGGIEGQVVYLGLLDKVISQLQVAFYSSIILSSPLWFHQIWLFIQPGLYIREIKVVRPFLLVGFFLFVLGVAFGYFLVFPVTFKVLMQFGVGEISASISLKEYLVLVSKILVFLGIVFQLPNVMLILGFMGIVDQEQLRNIRRYVYVGFAALSAMLTPPDVVTMLAIWLPLVVLYELGIYGVILIVTPFHKRGEK
ncbi:MAG: twin-arginine translocase subunit TatC [Bdellovibrionales bacterium]|jgi:sec-independent protein translocase protein TatC|nr:twin-arginine translocase subunit TatC [Bdellovibrionales bacterium]MBT3526440.1 twin-arginine translocase subunit TatC [Bdellovibrionales bacterium]MBT7669563.1 twin-arginine translocase subunit TatC [Bdellovibrionales bacterium]